MAIDNDNSDYYEARRNTERRTLEKEQAKIRQEKNPMKSFEAKLSKQASQEAAARESMSKDQQQVKKEVEERGDFLKKILGADASDSSADLNTKAKRHEHAFEEQKEIEKKNKGSDLDEKLEEKEKQNERAEGERKSAETSSAGHKRVDKLEEDGESDSQGGSRNFGSDSDSENQDSEAGSKDSQSQKDSDQFVGEIAFGHQSENSSSGRKSGSQQQALEELDEIVASVQHSFLENGEEMFAVTMTNDFFDGLQISTTRKEEGVILTFHCPNILVRSQIVKMKDSIWKRFSQKNIKVEGIKIL